METLGEVVRQRRKILRLSQTELAVKAGISQSYVSDIEKGEIGSPDRDKVVRVADVLGYPQGKMLRLAGYAPGEESSAIEEGEMQALSLYRSVHPLYREQYLRAVAAIADLVAGGK